MDLSRNGLRTCLTIRSPIHRGAGPEIIEARILRGRRIDAADVQAVRRLMAERPEAGRLGLAHALCVQWQWRSAGGRLKLRSALGIFSELGRGGWIELPAARGGPRPASIAAGALPQMTGAEGGLSEYCPLQWELVSTPEERRQWRELLARHHYLKPDAKNSLAINPVHQQDSYARPALRPQAAN